MIYIFPETNEANERTEKVLRNVKREYQKQHMSQEQLECLRQTITRAKEETNIQKRRFVHKWEKVFAMASVITLLFLVLPNTSYEIAYAMEQLPMLGNFVRMVTFREYRYDTERMRADITVPALVLSEEGEARSKSTVLEKTTSEINEEIQEITDGLVQDFEAYMHDELGYQQLKVQSESLPTIPGYFTLKLCCYQGAGSGYEWNYYYTINLSTGERVALKDLFVDGADYLTVISDNIKAQMAEQMQADDNILYWLNEEVEAWNFQTITEETSFYINENNCIVIAFNEGDVAPMYMGAVEFEIPYEVLEEIRKTS